MVCQQDAPSWKLLNFPYCPQHLFFLKEGALKEKVDGC
jgi:hypothetical protein